MDQTPVSHMGRAELEHNSRADSDHSESEYTGATMKSPPWDDTFPEGKWLDVADAYLNSDSLYSTGHANLRIEAGHPRLSSEWLQILQQGNKRYQFRDTARNTFLGTGFYDFDQSGDWNPDTESDISPRPRRQRHRKSFKVEDLKHGDKDGKWPKRRGRARSYEQGRKNGRSMRMQRQFSSKKGKGKSRATAKEQLSSELYAEEVPHPYQNEEVIYENLHGRHEARGCRDCYDIDLECSLIDDASSYPCEACKEDDQDCILMIHSEVVPCEQCNKKNLYCSYSHKQGEDAFAACDNCQHANIRCLAGPTKSAGMDDELSSIGDGAQPKPLSKAQNRSKRPGVRSNKARKNPMPRSKKTNARPIAERGPGIKGNNSSARRGRRCTSQKRQPRKPRGRKVSSKPESNLVSKDESPVPGGKVMFITTSFCHPIHFNWIPPPPLPPIHNTPPKPASKAGESSFPCHFCTNPGLSYALAGLGIRRVEVVLWDHDARQGYEELNNGWLKAGEECTRMCIQCTMERILICLCTDHVIRPIAGLDPLTFDFEAAFGGLMNQNLDRGSGEQEGAGGGGGGGPPVKWCSVCIEPAFFECCVTPPVTPEGRETAPDEDIGCGLLLCEVCALKMRGRHQHPRRLSGDVAAATLTPPNSRGGRSNKHPSGGDVFKAVMTLDQHIDAASKDYFQYPDGLRADVCFLKNDGELMRRQGAEDTFSADGYELDFLGQDFDLWV